MVTRGCGIVRFVGRNGVDNFVGRYYSLLMLNNNLSQLDAAISTKVEILDTYEGMAALYDGEGEYPAHIFNRIEDIQAEIAALEAQYNRTLIAMEG